MTDPAIVPFLMLFTVPFATVLSVAVVRGVFR